VGVSGKSVSVSMSVPWNAGFTIQHCNIAQAKLVGNADVGSYRRRRLVDGSSCGLMTLFHVRRARRLKTEEMTE